MKFNHGDIILISWKKPKGISALGFFRVVLEFFGQSKYVHIGVVVEKKKKKYFMHSSMDDRTSKPGIKIDGLKKYMKQKEISRLKKLKFSNTTPWKQYLDNTFEQYRTKKITLAFDYLAAVGGILEIPRKSSGCNCGTFISHLLTQAGYSIPRYPAIPGNFKKYQPILLTQCIDDQEHTSTH